MAQKFFANTVLDYFNSGVGSYLEPYGYVDPNLNDGLNGQPVLVNLNAVLGDDPAPGVDCLSLPTGSYVTVGLMEGFAIDGPNDDIFFRTDGFAAEQADVYVSSLANPTAADFTLLGRLQDGFKNSLDLASIGFTQPVRTIKVVGLDNGGLSPGFDLINVQLLQILTAAGDRILTGGNNDDLIRGGRKNDTLKGNGGNDLLIGDAGNDVLLGGDGDDRLIGNKGQNYLEGGSGRDYIICGRGKDIIAPDLMGINTKDVVQGFKDRQDRLCLPPGIKFKDLDFKQSGRDTTLRFKGEDVMTLTRMQVNQFSRADFIPISTLNISVF